jgi:hypothetical protein
MEDRQRARYGEGAQSFHTLSGHATFSILSPSSWIFMKALLVINSCMHNLLLTESLTGLSSPESGGR